MIAIITMGLVGLLCIAGFVIMLIEILSSPMGYEDETGFHNERTPSKDSESWVNPIPVGATEEKDFQEWFKPIPEWMFGNSVEARNALQNCGKVHPRTCGNNRTDASHVEYQSKHGGDFGQLVAVKGGWVCPVCGYKQPL